MSLRSSRLACLALLVLPIALSACSGGGGGGNSPVSVVQDLDADPDGLTTVLDFDTLAPIFGPGSLTASGGQTATSVSIDGLDDTRVIVVWDERVTPSHTVTVLGQPGIAETPRAVTTTDASAPTYSISSASQGVGLGNDTLVVAFSGPRVVPSQVEDGAAWILTAGIFDQPLTDSDLAFDVQNQELTIVTDEAANLHTNFTLRVAGLTSVSDTPVSASPSAGVASGDSTNPTVLSVAQNLGEDAFGRVVDVLFSEAIDPLFSNGLVNFSLGFPNFASDIEQIGADSFRLTFADPAIPGQVDLTLAGILDAHGNPYTAGAVAIAAGATFANSYALDPEVRSVAGAGNDELRVITTQAFDPDSAETAANWSLVVNGNTIDLSGASFSYNLLGSTLIATLPGDYLNGQAFTLTPNGVLEVDGQLFTTAFSGVVAGDSLAPGISFVLQNRNLDPTGATLDVHLTEAISEASAETLVNWTPSGGPSLVSATWQTGGDLVRLVFDAPAVPGVVTLAIQGLEDLAGNPIAPVSGVQSISTDNIAPTITASLAEGVEGPQNDRIQVTFDDLMYEADILAAFRWNIESPTGSALSTALADVSWDAGTRTATLTFSGNDNINFSALNDVLVGFTGIRDVGGNLYTGGSFGPNFTVEENLPFIESLFVKSAPNDNIVVVRLTEAVGDYADSSNDYVLYDNAGFALGVPSAAVLTADGRGFEMTFGQVVTPGFNRVSIRGVTDLAGNPAFPVINVPVAAEAATEGDFALTGTTLEALSGEGNDSIRIEFSEDMSSFGLTELANYSLYDQTNMLDVSLSGARLEPVDADTIDLLLAGSSNLDNAVTYSVRFQDLITAQGVQALVVKSFSAGAGGDSTAPDVSLGRAQIDPQVANSLLVDLDEACDLAGTEAQFLLDSVPAIGLTVLGPRTARVLFSAQPTVGQSLNVTATDLFGNVGNQTRAVTAADVNGPLLSGTVSAFAVEGVGGDYLELYFNEPLDSTSATDSSHYGLTLGGQTVSLTGVPIEISSVLNRVRIYLPAGAEFSQLAQAQVTVSGLLDWSGNPMASQATVTAQPAGDSTAPSLVSVFADTRLDPTGRTVAVLFSESCDPALMTLTSSYQFTGGQSVQSVSGLGDRAVRLQLSAALGNAESLNLAELRDLAGNSATSLSISALP